MTTRAPLAPSPTDVVGAATSVLARYVSAPTAQSILGVARRRTGAQSAQLSRAQLGAMLQSIEHSLTLFLADPGQAKSCRLELAALVSDPASLAAPQALVMTVRVEDDIARARGEARKLSEALGFTQIGQTRLITAVSELTRNIVQYAGEGQITLRPASSPPGLEIVAQDSGPGIPNVEQILAGNYRSKLGMGLGLRGVKRISERFEIQTEAGRGTTVSALIKVI
jgi:serine/threonine-protein kinase RsbT